MILLILRVGLMIHNFLTPTFLYPQLRHPYMCLVKSLFLLLAWQIPMLLLLKAMLVLVPMQDLTCMVLLRFLQVVTVFLLLVLLVLCLHDFRIIVQVVHDLGMVMLPPILLPHQFLLCHQVLLLSPKLVYQLMIIILDGLYSSYQVEGSTMFACSALMNLKFVSSELLGLGFVGCFEFFLIFSQIL